MEREIDLRKLFKVLLLKWWLIGSIMIFGGAVAFIISSYFITPQYQATTTMYVYNDMFIYNENRIDEELVTASDIRISQELISTYAVIIVSNSVLEKVLDAVDVEYTTDALEAKITAEAINGSAVIVVTVTHPDSKTAQLIANGIADIAPDVISQIVKAGEVEIIDYATLPSEPSSPNIMLNTVIGILLGMVIAMFIIVISALRNNKLFPESD